ncbi:hypothetical protein Hdeb2414_s0009g00315081 [Helianthus debilis subsp. tardiflorus]
MKGESKYTNMDLYLEIANLNIYLQVVHCIDSLSLLFSDDLVTAKHWVHNFIFFNVNYRCIGEK